MPENTGVILRTVGASRQFRAEQERCASDRYLVHVASMDGLA
jgi:hypothetical protein